MDLLARAKNRLPITRSIVIPTGTLFLLLVGVTVILVMASHLVFLTKYPPVFIDEPWYANVAWNWLQTGGNFDPMHMASRGPVQWGYLANFPWLLSFATLGLGLLQMRLPAWIAGVLLVGTTAWAGRRNYGGPTATVAALLLVVSRPFAVSSHYGRPDIVLATAIMMVYALASFALERERWWAHLLAGFLLTMSVDIHPNALMFFPGLAAMYLVAYRQVILRRGGTWFCLSGAALGILIYVVARLSAGSTVFLVGDGALLVASSHKPPVASLNPRVLLDSLVGQLHSLGLGANGLAFAVLAAGSACLAVRRRREDQLLLAFFGSAFVAFVLFIGNKASFYAILLYPFVVLVSATALITLLRGALASRDGLMRGAFNGALLVLLLVGGARDSLLPMMRAWDYNYYAVTERIERSVPVGARVMGMPNWWLGLATYDYRSSLNLTFYYFIKGYSLTQGLEADRPDIIIVDDIQRRVLVEQGYYKVGSGFDYYNLPRAEFEAFLAQRGRKVDEFTDPWHGRFEIYAIHW